MDNAMIYNMAERVYNLDVYEAMDNGETIENIAETIETEPKIIINYLLDIIDDLQA